MVRFAAGPIAVQIAASDPALLEAAAIDFQCPPAAADAEALDIALRFDGDGATGAVGAIELVSRGGAMAVENVADLGAVVHALIQDAVARACANRVALHAAACLSPQGSAVLFPGASGTGKSTTALAMALAGWRCLSDDLVFVDLESGHVNGCDPAIRLDEAASAELGPLPPGWRHGLHEVAGLEGETLRSHHYRPPIPTEPGPWSVPIGAVVFPTRGDAEPVPLSPGQALERLWPQRLEVRHTQPPDSPFALAVALAGWPMVELAFAGVAAIAPTVSEWWGRLASSGETGHG
jgi:hypothetical protein